MRSILLRGWATGKGLWLTVGEVNVTAPSGKVGGSLSHYTKPYNCLLFAQVCPTKMSNEANIPANKRSVLQRAKKKERECHYSRFVRLYTTPNCI